MRLMSVAVERWPIAGRFVISRGARTETVVVVVTLDQGSSRGHGECVPYARYGESVEGVLAAIERARPAIEAGADREALRRLMRPGAARNAIDCALWDLESKKAGVPAPVLAGLDRLRPAVTAFTLSLDEPQAMADAARRAADRPILKVKLGAAIGDPRRIAAVRDAVPQATLIVDANEGWQEDALAENFAACAAAGVALIEQPLPADRDGALARVPHPIPVCADESAHDSRDLADLAGRYDAINVKLDKTGGLTEALDVVAKAREFGLGIVVGCMVCTSLSIAPAMLLTPHARFVDLDGPLLLARDRPGGIVYEGSLVHPAPSELWG